MYPTHCSGLFPCCSNKRMRRLLVTLFVISIIKATAFGQGAIIQGPEDTILPLSSQAKFSCTANSSLNVTAINWLAQRGGTTWALIVDLYAIGITILPSPSKFTSEITVEGTVANNGTELICSVTVFGSLSVQSTATLTLYGPTNPVVGFNYSISGIHSFNLSWTPISSLFPFNYSISILPTASNATIENVLLNQNMTSYIYKGNTSLECEEYTFTIRTVNGAGNSESEVLTLTLPDVPSTTIINGSLVSFDSNGTPLITLTFNAPITCTDYPVVFYSLMLRVQYSSNNISLMIPVENIQLNGSKGIISFNNDIIEYDEDYMVSIAAVNVVGVSEASPEKRIITSSLQSISASLHGYQLRIICHFANGSLSTGCFVIVALANETELISESIIRPQLDFVTSNTTITLTMGYLHLPLIVIGSDYNNAIDIGLVRITATPLLISSPEDPNSTVINNVPTSITGPTTSVTASISTATGSIINTPTTTPQTVDSSGLSSGAIAGITISIFILLILVIILIIIALQCLYFKKKNKESAHEKEATAIANISSIPSVPNEAYAAVDSIVNVQENVAYSGHTITAASPPTGSSTAPTAVYKTINF